MRLRSAASLLCLLLLPLTWLGVRAHAQTPSGAAKPEPSYSADPKVKATMAEAEQLMKRHQYVFATDAYKKANKLAGGRCFECLWALYNAQMSDASYKDAFNTASQMEQIASTPQLKSVAEYREAAAIYEGAGEKPKPDKLQAAHGLLVEAIANSPKNAAALFLDGRLLAILGRMDEAKADFTACVSCVNPQDPSKLRAQHFAEDPELALHRMAPAFEVTALDGSKFNLDAMGGRVVLIDFWATWCGPCNAELPEMKKIAKEFAGQPLVMISVSWDRDEASWKQFVAKSRDDLGAVSGPGSQAE